MSIVGKAKRIIGALDEAAALAQSIEKLTDGATLVELAALAQDAERLVLALVPPASKARPVITASFDVFQGGIAVASEGATGAELGALLASVDELRKLIVLPSAKRAA